MLRRKLLLILFSLAGLLLVLAVAILLLVQSVLEDMEHMNRDAFTIIDQTNSLSAAISTIEIELERLRSGQTRHLDHLIDQVESLPGLAEPIGEHSVVLAPPLAEVYERLLKQLTLFEQRVSALATARDSVLASQYNVEAMAAAIRVRDDILHITRRVQEHAHEELGALTGRLFWLIISISGGFLLVLNASVVLLVRAAGMVLRPVDKLVEASRQLARERFDYRVETGEHDEFDELAHAFNSLAQQLRENEQRRLETLGQVALTLNHELNNAMTIIDLQLHLMERQAGPGAAFKRCLTQIHQSLGRMARVVQSLKHVRRIVLTEYAAGEKMLDLERSVQDDQFEPSRKSQSPKVTADT